MTARRRGDDGGASPSPVSTWHRPLAWFSAAMVVWGALCLVGLVVDPRTLAGDPVWAKPLKFAVSFGVYALTLAWMLSLVRRPGWLRAGWWVGTIAAAATTLEVVAVTVQAARGTGSHFNVATPVDSAVYALMGGAVVVLYSATVVVGAALAFSSTVEDRALVWGLRLGLALGLAGLSVGFVMVVPRAQQLTQAAPTVLGSHSVGGEATGGLPFLGWSTVQGDLRVSHFVGMHALQALPLVALTLGALAGGVLTEGTRLRILLLTAAAWASATALTVWQALRGQSVVHPDALTGTAVGVLLLLGTLAAAGIVRFHRRHPVFTTTG